MGIQIDSLADLIAFGVLPACIGIAMFRCNLEYTDTCRMSVWFVSDEKVITAYQVGLTVIAIFYVLAAMIRLAYFNVMEECG